MAWTIPDKGEGDNDLQSILFQEYLEILLEGINGENCVLSGGAVTGGADMTPAVAACDVLSNGVQYAVAAADVTIGAADATNPRLDLIVVNSSGALAVRAGTAAAAPKPPARTANDVVLAVVYVPANDTAIATSQITDLRVLRKDRGSRTFSLQLLNQTLSAAVIGTTRTVFGGTFTIKTGSLIAGVRYRITLNILHTSANTITSEITLCKDDATGTVLFSTGQLQIGSTTGNPGAIILDVIGTGAVGASVNVYTSYVGRNNHNTHNPGGHTAQPVALPTNADLVLAPCGDFSGTTSGHSMELVSMDVERMAA